jgi:hypothetical protein
MAQPAPSFVACPWAASLFGVQQLANLMSGNGDRKAEIAFYTVTGTVQEQFAANPAIFGLNQLGDRLQQSAVDFAWDVLRLKPFDPAWVSRTAGAAIRGAFDAARALTPGDNLSFTADVLRNTFAVVNLVNRAPAMLNLPPGELDLREAVDRAYSIGGDYASLWLVEGLGGEYAGRNWSGDGPFKGLLTSGRSEKLPEKCLLMMHAGMGISFARQLVRLLTPYTAGAELDAALRQFIALVKANARAGYQGPAYESLGLVTRTWYRRMVPAIDARLWGLDQEVLEYFWHGVGRAIYFDPRYLLPGATPFEGVQHEAPHQLGLLNGVAGAAWAFTLVNIRQPEVLLTLLRLYSAILGTTDAFTNGMVSAILMAGDMIPGDPNSRRLCGCAPFADPGLTATWNRMIGTPCRRGMTEYYPILKSRGRLGEVFRYQNFDALVKRLGGMI